MRFIRYSDIARMKIAPYRYYEWICEMLKNKAEVVLLAKISMKPTADRFYNVVPSLIPKRNVGGVKIVNRYSPKGAIVR